MHGQNCNVMSIVGSATAGLDYYGYFYVNGRYFHVSNLHNWAAVAKPVRGSTAKHKGKALPIFTFIEGKCEVSWSSGQGRQGPCLDVCIEKCWMVQDTCPRPWDLLKDLLDHGQARPLNQLGLT
jgi:hypothetical protein